MELKGSKRWAIAFIATPILYFITQFLPYYHSGGTIFPSLGSLFWFPEEHEQTLSFISLWYHDFRVNEWITALLITQFSAIFLIIIILIKKSNGTIAVLLGSWGLFGLISFFTTRALTFSPVMIYGGIASISMLVVFLAAVAISAFYLYKMYQNYKRKYVLALN